MERGCNTAFAGERARYLDVQHFLSSPIFQGSGLVQLDQCMHRTSNLASGKASNKLTHGCLFSRVTQIIYDLEQLFEFNISDSEIQLELQPGGRPT
jgi:hypothetical protein